MLLVIVLIVCLGSWDFAFASRSSVDVPEEVATRIGGTVRLECPVTGRNLPCQPMKWMKWVRAIERREDTTSWEYRINCTEKDPEKTRFKFQYKSLSGKSVYVMEIHNVEEEDSGAYSCGFGDGNTMSSNPGRVAVIGHWPQPTCEISPANPTIGSSVDFICKLPPVASTGLIPVTWTKPLPLDFGGTRYVGSNGSYIAKWTLWETDAHDKFTCQVGVGEGKTSCSVQPLQTNLHVVPAITRSIAGGSAMLTCTSPPSEIPLSPLSARTFPGYDYKWVTEIKNRPGTRKEITNKMASNTRFQIRNEGEMLFIKDLRQTDNRLSIWCEIKTQTGTTVLSNGPALVLVRPRQSSSLLSDNGSTLTDMRVNYRVDVQSLQNPAPEKADKLDRNIVILLVVFFSVVCLFVTGIVLTEMAGRRIRRSLSMYTDHHEEDCGESDDATDEESHEPFLKKNSSEKSSQSNNRVDQTLELSASMESLSFNSPLMFTQQSRSSTDLADSQIFNSSVVEANGALRDENAKHEISLHLETQDDQRKSGVDHSALETLINEKNEIRRLGRSDCKPGVTNFRYDIETHKEESLDGKSSQLSAIWLRESVIHRIKGVMNHHINHNA